VPVPFFSLEGKGGFISGYIGYYIGDCGYLLWFTFVRFLYCKNGSISIIEISDIFNIKISFIKQNGAMHREIQMLHQTSSVTNYQKPGYDFP